MLNKFYNDVELCKSVWNEKYLAKNEHKPSDAIKRISSIMPEIYFVMMQAKFIPGGRIIKGLGIDSNLTLMNCYVEGIQDDSLKAIFDTANNLAQIFRTGGGAGINISGLRPRGSSVNNAAKESSGAVSFMEIFDKVTGVVSQQGRRGALMINMEIAHPDIEEFITVKNDNSKSNLTNCNISVLIRDDFMLAVQEDLDWELWYPVKVSDETLPESMTVKTIEDCYSHNNTELFYIESLNEYRQRKVFKTIKAREIWQLIIKNAYDSAEPGLLFMDTIKEDHTLEEITPITGTNPCGEEPLPDKGSCNLGSMNLSQYITDPFTSYAAFDENEFVKDVQLAIEYLDKIVDQNIGKNALTEQDEMLKNQRRLGLGVMGLADAFAMLGMKYDSVSAKRFANEVFDLMETAAYIKSFELAKELGPFPQFNSSLTGQGHLRKVIEKGILDEEEVKTVGIRNATLLSIAPTGTLHIIGQCSSGIEPIFELEYTRNSESLKKDKFKVLHRAFQQYKEITGKDDKPDFFQTAYEVNPESRVILQGQIQQYIDTAISVTVNFPKSTKLSEIESVYVTAWENNCKGITVYREGSRSQVLVAGEEVADIRERYEVLEGKTIVIPSNPKIYLTANYNPVSNKIVEVFINSSKSGSDVKATSEGFGRLISLYLQKGGEVKDVVNTLLDIKGEETLFTKLGSFHSFPDTIAKALQNLAGITVVNKCPNCGNEIRMESGCMICMNCGYSKC